MAPLLCPPPDPLSNLLKSVETYALATFKGGQQKSLPFRSSRQPQFNHDFVFRSVDEWDSIRVALYKKKLVGEDKMLGEVLLTKAQLLAARETWFPLQGKGTNSGEMLLRFRFN